MKAWLRISIGLNLTLAGLVAFLLTHSRKEAMIPATVEPEPKPLAQASTSADADSTPLPPTRTEPFRWSQLGSLKNYRIFIANLRASGCPEATVRDIVRGDTMRAFAFERRQLGLDGYGSGPWSQVREQQLVASLLNGRPTAVETTDPAQSAENKPAQNTTTPAAYPLFLQGVNWSDLGFDASQQADIEQVRQQFLADVKGLNPNNSTSADPEYAKPSQNSTPINTDADNNPAPTSPWDAALQNADDRLRGLLGAQGYNAYVMQQYYAWFQPQVAANVTGGNLIINPDAFSVK